MGEQRRGEGAGWSSGGGVTDRLKLTMGSGCVKLLECTGRNPVVAGGGVAGFEAGPMVLCLLAGLGIGDNGDDEATDDWMSWSWLRILGSKIGPCCRVGEDDERTGVAGLLDFGVTG